MGDRPLRLLVFDRTCRGRRALPGLSHVWGAGRHLYRALGRLDAGFGADTWAQALDWLGGYAPGRRIAEIQYWGHGLWGQVRLGEESLTAAAPEPGHVHHDRLRAVAARMLRGAEGLVWFRTCQSFGKEEGHRFARAWSRFFDCRVAGHTYVIAGWQSGLHTLLPGAEPDWPVDEGVAAASPSGKTGLWSRRRAPRTVSFLHGRIPEDY